MHDQQHCSNHEFRCATPGRREALTAGAGMVIASLSAISPAAGQTAGGDAAGAITVTPASAQPAAAGATAYFTGAVQVQPLFPANGPARASGASVTFEPGARSAWHTHPLGQVLIVTAGTGWVQLWGGPKQDIRPGDVVWIPPGLKHWHGATATTSLTHTAIQEGLDGKKVDWMEQVTDAQYRS
jgi:quercetin dioxygenase-like cupin family protein